MAVPVAIFVVCFGGGAWAASRWLPDLAPGRVGGIAYFAVCGLLAAAVAVFGLDLYVLIENLSESFAGLSRRRFLADNLGSLLWQTGLLVAVALGVYLLAPPREEVDGPLVSGAEPGPGS